MARKADALRDLQERSEQVKADLIDVVGHLIQVSDQLIDAIHALPSEQAAEQAEILGELEQGRKLAFETMGHVNPDQIWFWTEEWQAGERAMNRDIAAGVPGATSCFIKPPMLVALAIGIWPLAGRCW
ncbi:MAG TPA: hypothetical protein VNL71_21130 [Chloroflexota bacterium]|nr:hypothetical protein [Chloroflexota bacterium]